MEALTEAGKMLAISQVCQGFAHFLYIQVAGNFLPTIVASIQAIVL